jgi:Cu2+-exporting ATPase
MNAVADWSVYDRPELRDSVSLPRAGKRRELLLSLDGIHCAACVGRVEKLLSAHGASARISLAAKTAEIQWAADREPLSALLRSLDDAGFAPRVLAQSAPLQAPASEQRAALIRIGIAVLGSMQVMMLAWPAYTHAQDVDPALSMLLRYAQWLFATPVVLYAGLPFFLNAWHALKAWTVNMDVPVALALAVAYGVSAARTVLDRGDVYFDSATMFVMLLAIGRYFEGRTRARASERLRVLAGQRALTAARRKSGRIEQVAIATLAIGDEVLVAPGDAVPVDGRVVGVAGELDEALLTGESRPVLRGVGDRALAGTVNVGTQMLTLRVDAVGAKTRLSQITQLLQRAQSQRPAFALLADRISGAFIVVVLVLSIAAGWFWLDSGFDTSLSVALAILVASCPCALALAVPAAFAAATSRLAAEGILVVNPRALSRLAQVDTVLFDKTGTLTSAQFQIAEVVPASDVVADECLRIAAALEAGGIHPIARAFAQVETPNAASQVTHMTGRGIGGVVRGRHYFLGAVDATGAASDLPAALLDQPHLTWLVLRSDRPLAYIGLSSPARPESRAIVGELQRAGRNVHLLSGDSAEAVRALARDIGIGTHHARQTPEQKLAHLQALQSTGRVVLAVGDGVNDAPLLGAADIAVVMPQGAALAQGSADAILIGDSLAGVPRLIEVGARVRRLIAQNIAWALLYNIAVLPLAAANMLHPWLAALGMSVSSLLVVGNALRIGKPSKSPS